MLNDGAGKLKASQRASQQCGGRQKGCQKPCQWRDAFLQYHLCKVVLSVVLSDAPGINLGTLPINFRGKGANTNKSKSGVFHSILQYIPRIVLGEAEGLKENLRRDSDFP